ncbi:MAG: hypothetical protein LBD02_00585 [Christensenellaceae bacterium]|nr:hypothetical protein [Christensenellaceae bacterium]
MDRPTYSNLANESAKAPDLQKLQEADRWVSLRQLRGQPHETTAIEDRPTAQPAASQAQAATTQQPNSLYSDVLRRHAQVSQRAGLPGPVIAQQQQRGPVKPPATTPVLTPQTLSFAQNPARAAFAEVPAPQQTQGSVGQPSPRQIAVPSTAPQA